MFNARGANINVLQSCIHIKLHMIHSIISTANSRTDLNAEYDVKSDHDIHH
jgi:hypothetical protein